MKKLAGAAEDEIAERLGPKRFAALADALDDLILRTRRRRSRRPLSTLRRTARVMRVLNRYERADIGAEFRDVTAAERSRLPESLAQWLAPHDGDTRDGDARIGDYG